MENTRMSLVSPLSDQAKRFLIDTGQLYEAFEDAARDKRRFKGGMTWKRVGEREYLIRIVTSHGGQKSLGPRSETTEVSFQSFVEGKSRADERHDQLKARIGEQAALNRALKIGHISNASAKILRALALRDMLGRNVIVAGTNAIYAYEGMAAVRVADAVMETGDLDLLWDSRTKLVLNALPEAVPGVLETLKSVDKTFETSKTHPYRATAASGFAVDLIRAENRRHPWADTKEHMADGDLLAAPILNMTWIVNAPKVDAVIVDDRGYPVPISAPDPRAFAVYKMWMGTNDPARDPRKRSRDVAQANIVARIVRDYFPNLPMRPEHLRMFPKEVLRAPDRQRDDNDPFWSSSGQ
jgi:hypothetical protein